MFMKFATYFHIILLVVPSLFPAQQRVSKPLVKSSTQLIQTDSSNRVRFVYKGTDVVMEFCLEPGSRFWGPMIVKMNMRPVATVLLETGPVFRKKPTDIEFVKKWIEEKRLFALWKVHFLDSSIDVISSMELRSKNLVIDFRFSNERIKIFNYGAMTDLREPELLPPLIQTTGLPQPPTLQCKGLKPFLVSFRIDVESSHSGSRRFGREISESGTWQLGSVDYGPLPDDTADIIMERFTLIFSPVSDSK